jgi:hypothetical protein
MHAVNIVRDAWGWLNLADYDRAKEQGTDDIIGRYARGNVNFQNNSCLDDSDLQELSAAGDKAMAKLKKRLP